MNGFFAGFLLGLSLIFAIGAQNAFVLRQGLLRQYVFTLCLICALSDAVLILAGVFGFGLLNTALPWLEPVARWGGALVLFLYGLASFRAALARDDALVQAECGVSSWTAAVATCLALTWLNPHVYLDTVVLLGSVATQYPHQRVEFAAGAALASLVFFFALGYGARMLAPLFRRPFTWKVLDALIGCVMWWIGFSLVRDWPVS